MNDSPNGGEHKSSDAHFTRAIVRRPGRSMVNGISSSNLGVPNYTVALAQHEAYVEALRNCGLETIVLEPDEAHPDSTFVEDAALVTPTFAILMNPGAPSRRGEIPAIAKAVSEFRERIWHLELPGTADAGDIMVVNGHAYIGLSRRTNAEGANQILQILASNGMTGSTIPLRTLLHLKSGAAYIENGYLVLAGELIGRSEFSKYTVIPVDGSESYAANCLWLNGAVLMASGYPNIRHSIETRGFRIIALEMSEFRKLDGGLSCLSLRFL